MVLAFPPTTEWCPRRFFQPWRRPSGSLSAGQACRGSLPLLQPTKSRPSGELPSPTTLAQKNRLQPSRRVPKPPEALSSDTLKMSSRAVAAVTSPIRTLTSVRWAGRRCSSLPLTARSLSILDYKRDLCWLSFSVTLLEEIWRAAGLIHSSMAGLFQSKFEGHRREPWNTRRISMALPITR